MLFFFCLEISFPGLGGCFSCLGRTHFPPIGEDRDQKQHSSEIRRPGVEDLSRHMEDRGKKRDEGDWGVDRGKKNWGPGGKGYWGKGKKGPISTRQGKGARVRLVGNNKNGMYTMLTGLTGRGFCGGGKWDSSVH